MYQGKELCVRSRIPNTIPLKVIIRLLIYLFSKLDMQNTL